MLTLFERFVWRLVAASLPLDRASLHIGTLHPQIYGIAWNWNLDDGVCDEVKVTAAVLESDAYKKNPLYRVIEFGEAYRGDTRDAATTERHPLMADLAKQGIVDYVALPLRTGGAYHNAATVATKQEGGFSDAQIADLKWVLKLFTLHVERHIALLLAGNVLDTYLGAAAGGRVLRGSIKRGDGEAIRAVIWVSDMRGFTDMADRLGGRDTTAVLNAYFERLVEAVLSHGGEVLKFIGDGLLAVFPYASFDDESAASRASLDAALEALDNVEELCKAPPEDLAAIDGWRPLHTGIALHEGEVFFGNVGAPDRLDFTVIGRAVNAASRIEALSKTLRYDVLVSEPVADRLEGPLVDLGEHSLRGLAEKVSIFGLRARAEPK